MTTMNISLPDEMKDYVKERCQAGDFSNPSDFVRALIREDKKRRAEEKLEALLIEGLQSGRMEVDKDYLNQKLEAAVERRKKQA